MEHSTHVEKQEAKPRFVGENTFIKHQQWRSNIRIEYRWFKEFFLSLSHKKQELTFITGIKQNSVAYNLSCYFSHQNLDLKISKTEFTVHTDVYRNKNDLRPQNQKLLCWTVKIISQGITVPALKTHLSICISQRSIDKQTQMSCVIWHPAICWIREKAVPKSCLVVLIIYSSKLM